MCDSGDECDFDVRLAQFLCKKMNKGMPNVTVAPDNRVNAEIPKYFCETLAGIETFFDTGDNGSR